MTTNNDRQHTPTARYPTTRELIAAALADLTTHANPNPTQTTPNSLLSGQDVDGNPRTLAVVALGGRIALVDPHGHATVLPSEAAHDLTATIEDSLYHKVHGGDMTIGGEVTVDAKHEIFLTEKATVSVTVRPYTETVELNFESISARLTCSPNLNEIRALKQILTDTETTMLSWHKTTTEPIDS
jgi:hypothetical protein